MATSTTPTFGTWLRGERKQHDLTQEGLAERAGCSWEMVRKIESGAARPSRQLVELLTATLEVPVAERPGMVQWARSGQSPARAAPGPPAPAPTPRDLPNPYKGLRAFQEADAFDFFGREALTAHLLARLAADEPFARFLAVVGPSGSGKSSVVRAGLLPALRRGAVPGSAHWTIVDLVPGPHPFDELESVLLRQATNPPAQLRSQLQEHGRGLLGAAECVLPPHPDACLLLVVNHLEAIFTLVEDEATRVHFLQSLYAAVTEPRSPVRVLVTLRADFYDRPLRYASSAALLAARTEIVPPLAPDELERAIVDPAARVGVSLDPALLAALIADTGRQPGSLPLLQYALTELFERRDGNRLTLAAYRASGGVSGALGRRAEALFAGLTPAEQAEAGQLFLRLVALDDEAEATRRRVRRAELASAARDEEALHRVLDLYGAYRLLTFDRDPVTGGPTVELAHEALLHTWGRLRWLLASKRDCLLVRRRLRLATGEWEAAGQDASYLATGARLAEFATLSSQSDLALTTAERAYVEVSLGQRDHQEDTERDRQARLLELARQSAAAAERAAAESQRAATAQRRAGNRLRVLVAALTLVLLVAVALALVAFV